MKYLIISGDIDSVEGNANRYLAEGWKLQGGVAMHGEPQMDGFLFAQAMVLEESPCPRAGGVIACAQERIEAGDMIEVDPMTGKARRAR